MAANTDLRRLGALARGLGYTDPQDTIDSVAWQAQVAPMIGENIVKKYTEDLFRDKTEVVCGEDDLDLREAEMYCMESNLRLMHSAGDNLAQAVNRALNLGVAEAACSLGNVKNALVAAGDCGDVVASIEAFTDSKDWGYLQSFVNTNKHREAILPEAFGVHIGADGYREGCITPEFRYTPLGNNKAEIVNPKMYRSELSEMRDRQVGRIDAVFAGVLKVLETRAMNAGLSL